VRRVLVLLVLVGTLGVVPAAAAPPPWEGGSQRTLAPGDNWRWRSQREFRPHRSLTVLVAVDDVITIMRGRLPLRVGQSVDGVSWSLRSPLYPDGRRRLVFQAGNDRGVQVNVRVAWTVRPQPQYPPSPSPIAICDCAPKNG
jgi:hypothetical protein